MKNTIKSHKNFKFPESNWIVQGPFHFKWRDKLFDGAEYGLVVTKKTFPTAVARNRAKRLLRVWIMANKLPQGHDLLFVARPSVLETARKDGIRHVKTALKKMEKLGRADAKA